MDAHQYLALAEALAESASDDPDQPNVRAVRRSAISRAYYALFLIAREFVDNLGIDTKMIPNAHATLEHALMNSGVLSLRQIANAFSTLRTERTRADYDMRNTEVEEQGRVDAVVGTARVAILQLDIIRAGRLSPPLDRDAVTAAILRWAAAAQKPLWKRA